MSKTLKMTFQLDGTKTVTYSLAAPKYGLTKAEVEGVMNTLIEKKAFVVKGIYPIGIKEALIKSTEDIALA